MTDEARFREFLARAEDLAREPFVASGFTVGPNIVVEVTPELNPLLQSPPEVEFKSVVSLVRQFVSAEEPINVGRVANLLTKHLIAATESEDGIKRNRAREILRILSFQRKLRENSMTHVAAEAGMDVYGRRLRPDEVMGLWFNAEYAHTDVDKREMLGALSDEQRLRLKHAFFGLVTTMIIYALTLKRLLEDACAYDLLAF